MGSKNSKLDGQPTGMLKGWTAPRAVFLSHRRQTPPTEIIENVVQSLSPLKISNTPMLDENDDNVKKDEGIVVDNVDNILGVDIQKEERDEVESEEEEGGGGYERRDMIMLRSQSSSPSFRVYCLDTCQSDYDYDDDYDCDADDLIKATMEVTRQSSQNSNDEGSIKIPRRKWRRRRFGAAKNLLHLKFPYPRRSISTGSIVDKSDRHHHFQMPRISNFRTSIGGIMRRSTHQHPTVDEGGSHHHHHRQRHQQRHQNQQLCLPEAGSHQSTIDINDNKQSHDENQLMKPSNIVETNSQHDCEFHGADNEDNNRHTCDADQYQQKHHNHHSKFSCISHRDESVRDDDDINPQHSHTHTKHGLPHMSFWNKARRQVRGGRTTHNG